MIKLYVKQTKRNAMQLNSIYPITPFQDKYIKQLENAVLKNDIEKISSLVRYIPNHGSVEAKVLALHTLTTHGKKDAVYQLLCQFTTCDSVFNGQTLIHHAVNSGNNELLQLILVLELNKDHQDLEGKTPLHIAAEKGNALAVAYLTNRRANVNLQDSAGDTALHKAVYARNINSIRAILNSSLYKLNFQNNDGKTPLQLALNTEYYEAAKELDYTNSIRFSLSPHFCEAKPSRYPSEGFKENDLEFFREPAETFSSESSRVTGRKRAKTTRRVEKRRKQPVQRKNSKPAQQNENKEPKCKMLEALYQEAKLPSAKEAYRLITKSNEDTLFDNVREFLSLVYPDQKNCKEFPLENILKLVIKFKERFSLKYISERFDLSNIEIKTNNINTNLIHYSYNKASTMAFSLMLLNNYDPNAQDHKGNTILHKVIKDIKDYYAIDTTIVLFRNKSASVNIPNKKGLTAFDLAKKHKLNKLKSVPADENKEIEDAREILSLIMNHPSAPYSAKKRPLSTSSGNRKSIQTRGVSDTPITSYQSEAEKNYHFLLEASPKVSVKKLESVFSDLYKTESDYQKYPIEDLFTTYLADNNLKLFRFLLQKKISFEWLYKENSNPLFATLKYKTRYAFTENILRTTNVDVNQKNSKGDTPLHLILKETATEKRLKVIELILNKPSCRLDIPNKKGKTALDIVQNSNKKKLKDLFSIYTN